MKVVAFESFEDLAKYISSNEEAAKLAAGQRDGLLKALTHGTYFVSVLPEEQLVIFGKVEQSEYPEDDAGIAESRNRGYIFGRCYSVACPEGELGDTHITNVTTKISEAVFNRAKANGWRHVRDEN